MPLMKPDPTFYPSPTLAAQGGLGMSTVNPATFDAGAMGGAFTMGF